jgi:hypothetical protein
MPDSVSIQPFLSQMVYWHHCSSRDMHLWFNIFQALPVVFFGNLADKLVLYR